MEASVVQFLFICLLIGYALGITTALLVTAHNTGAPRIPVYVEERPASGAWGCLLLLGLLLLAILAVLWWSGQAGQ